jgi:uncharacterized protein (DUF362 family)
VSAPSLPARIAAKQRIAAPVALVSTLADKERIIEDVHKAMELAEWKRFVTPGADIALKPNLGWDKLIPGAISAPWVFEGVIIAIKDYVGKVTVVESDQVVVDVRDAIRISRIDEVCKRHNVDWTNMSEGKFVHVRDTDQLTLHNIHLPEILTRTELITVPLMKTHNKSTITGAIKNQWGCLQTLRHNFHPVLSKALVDVNTLLQPRFAVMDATVGLEGNGPKSGISKEMNLVLASANLVGLDATAARLMGFDPILIEHLILCEEHGLGAMGDTLRVVGEPVEKHRQAFVPARHNAVSYLEMALRTSLLAWLVFRTPVFKLMCWGARRYYDLWDWRVGRALRHQFMTQSRYAAQWLD